MKARILRQVEHHGGIQTTRTHRAPYTDRETGQRRIAWANTITCRDGYQRQLTTSEEKSLANLPEELKGVEHICEDDA